MKVRGNGKATHLGHRFADWTVGLYGHRDLWLAAQIVKAHTNPLRFAAQSPQLLVQS
jgi:hypothetical protein